MAPRTLDFTDGFTSSSSPTSTGVSSTDNAIVRFDGVNGAVQNSGVLIDDNNDITFPANIITPKQDVATAASIAQLASSKTFYRFTGSTATSVLGIAAGADGQQITIHNSSTAIVTFMHQDAGAMAADRFNFVDDEDIELDPDSSIEFIYDSTQSRWVIKSGAGTQKLVGYQEAPIAGVVNGINPNFQVTQEPVTADSIIVFVDGIARPNSEWSISGTTITFGGSYIPQTGQDVYFYYLSKGTPNPAPPPPSGTFEVEYRTLTVGEAAAKQLTLSATPSVAAKVVLDIIGGTSQEYGVDFIVSGSTLDWTGLGLDGVLTSGDKLRIFYFS